MRRTYWKSLWRGIWHNLGRFLAVFGIILISTLLISGLGTLGSTVKASFNQEMIKNKFPDIILKSKVAMGFTTEEKNMLLNQPDIDESRMEEIYFYDTTIYLSALLIKSSIPIRNSLNIFSRAKSSGDIISLYSLNFITVL